VYPIYQMTEDRGQMSEDRCQKTDDRSIEFGSRTRRRPIRQDYAAAKDAEVGNYNFILVHIPSAVCLQPSINSRYPLNLNLMIELHSGTTFNSGFWSSL